MDKLSILLLWEGRDAKRSCRRLRESFRDEWMRQNRTVGPTIEFNDVADFPNAASGTFLDDVLRLIRQADCAIALQGPQLQLASSGRGNLWLEVGLWLGIHGRERLFIASKQERLLGSRVPSNLNGVRICSFRDDAELDRDLTIWLRQQRPNVRAIPLRPSHAQAPPTPSQPSDERPPSHAPIEIPGDWRVERVRATLGASAAAWLQQHMTLCAKEHGKCSCSEDALTFVAELLRMGRATRELADVAAQLTRVNELASQTAKLHAACSTGAAGQPSANWALVRASMRELQAAVHGLGALGGTLLRRDRDKSNRNFDQWKRLEDFLRFRLDNYSTHGVAELRTNLRLFMDRAVEYSDTKIFELDFFHGATSFKPDKLEYFGEFSGRVAKHLDQLRVEWFVQTKRAMDRHFETFDSDRPVPALGTTDPTLTSLASTLQRLGRLSQELPHNTDWAVRVWPQISEHSELT